MGEEYFLFGISVCPGWISGFVADIQGGGVNESVCGRGKPPRWPRMELRMQEAPPEVVEAGHRECRLLGGLVLHGILQLTEPPAELD